MISTKQTNVKLENKKKRSKKKKSSYLQRKSIHVSTDSETRAGAGANGADNAGLGHRPQVLDPKLIELGTDKGTGLKLLEGELRVLMDAPAYGDQPIEEVWVPGGLEKLLERVLGFRVIGCKGEKGEGEEDGREDEEKTGVEAEMGRMKRRRSHWRV